MTIALYVAAVIVGVLMVLALALWRLVQIVEAVGCEPGGLKPPANAEGENNDTKVETNYTEGEAIFTDIEKKSKVVAGVDVNIEKTLTHGEGVPMTNAWRLS